MKKLTPPKHLLLCQSLAWEGGKFFNTQFSQLISWDEVVSVFLYLL